MLPILKHLLWPIALIYALVVRVRNWLFDMGIKQTIAYPGTICIGNLTVGGTGKTPFAEYLINLLTKEFNIALLSRGYKRKTKGFVLATTNSTASTIGDEPFQIARKYPKIPVAVDGNRQRGIATLRKLHPENEIIILDDAFQHRKITADLNILLTDYSNPIYSDFFLPVGRLRDGFVQRKRAQMVVVTKCPSNLTPQEQHHITQKLNLNSSQQIFFATISYGQITPIFPESNAATHALSPNLHVLAMAGIANPQPFFEYMAKNSSVEHTIALADHAHLSKKKISAIFNRFSQIEQNQKIIVTTEKDASKIIQYKQLPQEVKQCFYFLPMEMRFIGDNQEKFNSKLYEYARSIKANSSLH